MSGTVGKISTKAQRTPRMARIIMTNGSSEKEEISQRNNAIRLSFTCL